MSSVDPRSVYEQRRDERRAARDRLARLDDHLSRLRLVAFAAAALVLWLAYDLARAPPALGWALGGLFFAAVLLHGRVVRRRAAAARAVEYYEAGLARLDERWQGKGAGGSQFADEKHPYAADLDLFGPGSLFERLCTCRTLAGEAALAAWLSRPAEAAEVRARQAAVGELRGRVELREDLALAGDAVRAEVDAATLEAWATAPLRGGSLAVSLGLLALAAATLTLGGLWLAAVLPPWPFAVAFVAELAVLFTLRRLVAEVTRAVDRPERNLLVVARLLARLERERFETPRLAALCAELAQGASSASARILRLARLVDQLNVQRNQMFIPLAILLLWGPLWAGAIERWRARSGAQVTRWLAALGELEALCALSAYAFERPGDPFPELVDEGPRFDGEGLGHPLIPDARSVRNDVRLGGPLRLLLVSGSNMSGKSTLLRTIGTNTVLALAGAPVRATRLVLSPLQVGATLRVLDSLAGGESRFYAEILRLRQLVELAGKTPPLLFLLDEILHGTNSHDRRRGAEAVLRGLLRRGAIGLCTTHDLALADMAEALGAAARNVHFEDTMEGGTLHFDYKMREGVVRRSNALELMRAVGLEVEGG
jgi:hypothetical protein